MSASSKQTVLHLSSGRELHILAIHSARNKNLAAFGASQQQQQTPGSRNAPQSSSRLLKAPQGQHQHHQCQSKQNVSYSHPPWPLGWKDEPFNSSAMQEKWPVWVFNYFAKQEITSGPVRSSAPGPLVALWSLKSSTAWLHSAKT